MLPALALILVCQLAGEALGRAASLTIPGPVIGMVLLVAALIMRAPLPRDLGETADGILKHLSLLFVPAGVGIVQNLSLLEQEGFRIGAVVVLSTIIALTVTAIVFAALARLIGASGEPDTRPGSRSGD